MMMNKMTIRACLSDGSTAAEALEAGKPVLTTKPFALNANEARKLVQAARKRRDQASQACGSHLSRTGPINKLRLGCCTADAHGPRGRCRMRGCECLWLHSRLGLAIVSLVQVRYTPAAQACRDHIRKGSFGSLKHVYVRLPGLLCGAALEPLLKMGWLSSMWPAHICSCSMLMLHAAV